MIKRKTPLKRKPWKSKKPRKRISPISQKRKAVLSVYEKVKREHLKGCDHCEACLAIRAHLQKRLGDDFEKIEALRPWSRISVPRPVEDIHHTRGRQGERLTETEWWAAVCRYCHDWAHANPLHAKEILTEKGIPLMGSRF